MRRYHAEEKELRTQQVGDGALDAEGNAFVEEEEHGGREREGLQESVEVGERGKERGRSAGGAEQRAEEVSGVEI